MACDPFESVIDCDSRQYNSKGTPDIDAEEANKGVYR